MFARALASLLLAASATPQPTPVPTPMPTPDVPVYAGAPAVRFGVDVRTLGFDANGDARVLVVTRFYDANGSITKLLANSDVDWRATDAHVRWQTRMRFGQPAAIVSADRLAPIRITIHVDKPELGTQRVVVDPQTWQVPRVVATALGAHSAQIGWYPRARAGARVDRIGPGGARRTIASLGFPSSSFHDTNLRPATRYRYVVSRPGEPVAPTDTIQTRTAPPPASVANVTGKGAWLFFTTNALDPKYFANLDPKAIVARAVESGLHYVELRTAYGAYDEIEPQAKRKIDAIVDGLAARGIGTIAWTVPRDVTPDDLERSVAAAYYRTSRGTPFAGLAIDLERGDEFMGGAEGGTDALARYVADVRDALGPRYLIVSTVEDPYVEHLSRTQYPYDAIARSSDVLQPMAYWRLERGARTTPQDVRATLVGSFSALRRLSGSHIPIVVGGQTGAQGASGYPAYNEIAASLQESRSLGALGECFFDWENTQWWQWDAMRAYPWPSHEAGRTRRGP